MLWRISRTEFTVAAATAVIGLTAGLLVAVVAGVLMTLFLVLREIDQSRLSPLVAAPGGGWTTDPDSDGDPTPETLPRPVPGALMLRFDIGLYTANTRRTTDRVVALARGSRPVPTAVVLESSALRLVTSTVLDGLTDLDRQLTQLGATLYLVRVPSTTRRAAQASPWFAALDASGRVQPTVDAALASAGLSLNHRNDEGDRP
jgi:SulP family sulfate permease